MWDRTMRFSSLAFVWLTISGVALGQNGDLRNDPDREYLRDARLPTDGPGLLEYLGKLSGDDADLERLDELIRQLGGSNFAKRAEASRRLVGLGEAALAKLQVAQKDADVEVAKRATKCIQDISEKHRWGVPFVVVRFLGKLRPDGLAEALLRYLPYTGDPDVEEEIWFGFYALVKDRPQLLKVAEKHLNDPIAARRALSACVVGRLGSKQQQETVRKLLADADPMVRLRAAQGLLAGKDSAGIPTLIDLLSQPGVDISWSAEELLHWVARDSAPPEKIGSASAKERTSCREAWQDWWKRTEGKIRPLLAENWRPGLLLVVDGYGESPDDEKPQAWLRGCDGKPRWQFKPDKPMIIELAKNNRLLARDNEDELTERSFEGAVVWRPNVELYVSFRAVPDPVKLPAGVNDWRRLPNGNTLLVCAPYILEVTAGDSKQVFHRASSYNSPARLRLLKNGRLLLVSSAEGKTVFTEWDGLANKPIRSAALRIDDAAFRNVMLEETPAGTYLCSYVQDKYQLCELSRRGTFLWKLAVKCDHGLRLRSGNTLIAARMKLAEVTPAGRPVWEARLSRNGAYLRHCLPLVQLGFDVSNDSNK